MISLEQARRLRNGHSLHGDCNQCVLCGLLFVNLRAYEQHRAGPIQGPRRCLSTVEMARYGMTPDRSTGFWKAAGFTDPDKVQKRIEEQEEQPAAAAAVLAGPCQPVPASGTGQELTSYLTGTASL